MIPKIIHYVWLGGNPLGEQEKKYIDTWKKFCPDYEIKRWDETNFNVNENKYCRQALEQKKWAFASDYIRLKVLYEYGGIYLDTDVELTKPLDNFLKHEAFVGLEDDENIATCVIGAKPKNEWIESILKTYKNRNFINKGKMDLTTNVVIVSALTKHNNNIMNFENKFHDFKNVVIYPRDYFSPIEFTTKKINITKNTHSIHHFAGSWVYKQSPLQKIKGFFRKVVKKILGKKNVEKIKHKKAMKKIK